MKLNCCPETDSLYIDLATQPGAQSRGVSEFATNHIRHRTDAKRSGQNSHDASFVIRH
jgi:hypothetical protein